MFTEDLWQIFKSHADLQTTYKLRSDRLNRGKPRKIQKTTIETGVNTCGTFKYKIPWWFSKNLPVNAGDTGLIPGREDSLKKEMANPYSILTWKIPWAEEPGGLRSPWGHKESDVT